MWLHNTRFLGVPVVEHKHYDQPQMTNPLMAYPHKGGVNSQGPAHPLQNPTHPSIGYHSTKKNLGGCCHTMHTWCTYVLEHLLMAHRKVVCGVRYNPVTTCFGSRCHPRSPSCVHHGGQIFAATTSARMQFWCGNLSTTTPPPAISPLLSGQFPPQGGGGA